MRIEVLLASYNGERYITHQLQSLLDQDHPRFVLRINDDGSSDQTGAIVGTFQGRFEHLHLSTVKCGGPTQNFAYLMSQCEGDYALFADQDDVWVSHKVSRLVEFMQQCEARYGVETPLLIHTDARLVDGEGKTISPSMWQYQALNPHWADRLNLVLTQNIVTGCTMMANRALLDRALPFPPEARSHDWWLAVVASGLGKVVPLQEALVLYRQHSQNQLGADKFGLGLIVEKILEKPQRLEERKFFAARQAGAFAERYGDSAAAPMARSFSQLPSMSYFARILTIFRYRFFKMGVIRNVWWIFRSLPGAHRPEPVEQT